MTIIPLKSTTRSLFFNFRAIDAPSNTPSVYLTRLGEMYVSLYVCAPLQPPVLNRFQNDFGG
jgi:hypothetical protein